jgi:hypothetical protein
VSKILENHKKKYKNNWGLKLGQQLSIIDEKIEFQNFLSRNRGFNWRENLKNGLI